MATFPPLSQTFVMREIRQLRVQGWNVVIGQLRPTHKTHTARGFEDLNPFVIPVSWFSFDMVVGLLFFLIFRPRRAWDCLRITARSWKQPAQFLKMTYVLLASMRLAFRHRDLRVEIVRAHFLHTEALAARFIGTLLEVPYSITVYTVFVDYPKWIVSDIVRHAVFVVADTAQAKEFILSLGGSAEKVQVVYNSVDFDEFPLRTPMDEAVPPVVLAVARLDPKKGFDVLLLACSILLRRGVDFRCVVVGDGAERKRLLAMRQSLQLENHVEMPGKLSFGQVKSWLYRAAVFAMPSVVTPEGETDGLPTVVIEAMASSLPIVGTWTAGIPEAVHEQVNGFLVPPNAPELFADRVQFLLATPDLRARFGTEGRRLAEMHFDLKRKASIISELIRQYVGFSPHSSPLSLPQSEHVLQSQEPQ